MQIDIDTILHSPDFMLYQLELPNSQVHFLKVTEDSYRQSPFMDQRVMYTDGQLIRLPIDTVLNRLTQIPKQTVPMDFLFHSSFCCSTLLAKSLDAPGRTLVLREPWPVYQLSAIQQRLTDSGLWDSNRTMLMNIVLTLLSKRFNSSEHILIKPANTANNLIDDLFFSQPSAKGILLYSKLDNFLVSYLKQKNQEARKSLPRLAASAAALVHYRDFFPDLVPGELPYLKAAVIFWHAQMLHFLKLLHRYPRRLKTLMTAELLAEPIATLKAAIDWLDLPLNDAHIQEIVHGPIWHSRAKNPNVKYGPEERETEKREIVRRHRTDIETAIRWAEPFLRSKPVDALCQYALRITG
jgi:hypothetical protein